MKKTLMIFIAVAILITSCAKKNDIIRTSCSCMTVNVHSYINSNGVNTITGADTTYNTGSCTNIPLHWVAYSSHIGDANDSTYTTCK